MADNLNGKIQLQGELVPDGGSEKQPVTDGKYVSGTPQTFGSVEELIAFHPIKMKRGMSVKVAEADPQNVLKITEYILMAEPAIMYDPQTLAIKVTVENYLNYWVQNDETYSEFNRVQEYAPSGLNGASPNFPYEAVDEANWTPVYDASKGHNWFRFRDDDIDVKSPLGVFDNWSVPISIGSSISGGDFVANAYARQNINQLTATIQAELVVTNLGGGDSGWFQVTLGDIDVDAENLTVGKYFKYDGAKTYTFNNSATAEQVLPAPDRSYSGSSNDTGLYTVASGLDSILYTDGIPAGTDTLWEITGQKSVYGALKSSWVIRLLSENASLTRYSIGFTALPSTVCDNTQDAGVNPYDADLEGIGWFGGFLKDATYLATRTETGSSPPYTDWQIQKIAGENGEFKDRAFKLFPITTDFDLESAPTQADATKEDWSDTPLAETPTTINGITESTKFFDRTLKTPWSKPVAFTGKDNYNDVIRSSDGDTFKYNPNGTTPATPDTTEITLEAQLYRSIDKLWIDETITYVWERVYNDGAPDSQIADNTPSNDFYYLPSFGTQGNEDYKINGQRLLVKNTGVDGKAVFKCTQTLTLDDLSTVVFVDEYVIVDIFDGKDAKDLSASADKDTVLYDVGNTVFSPTTVRISAFANNLPSGFTLYWYVETAPNVWSPITSGVGGYEIIVKPYGSQLELDTLTVFNSDGDLEQKRYAVSSINGDPELADNDLTFTDYQTIVKTDSAATAVDGTDAVYAQLSNESIVTIVDNESGEPRAGEIGTTGKVRTKIKVVDGVTPIPQGAGEGKYTVVLDNTDNPDIVANTQVSGSDIEIYINAGGWLADERAVNIKAVITYNPTGGGDDIILEKIFSINSTLDAEGAISLVITAADGRYSFTAADRSDITLNAELYNDQLTPTLQPVANYWYSWKIGAAAWGSVIAGGGGTNGEIKTLTRNSVRFNAIVKVRIFLKAVPILNDDIIREDTIEINDIVDGKTFHLYATDVEPFSKPLPPPANINMAVGNSVWKPSVDPDPAIWGVDGTEKPHADQGDEDTPEYTYGDVYQIGAEGGGDQGVQGGGYFRMYNTSLTLPTIPSDTATIEQLWAAGWVGFLPFNDIIWVTERLYQGDNGSGGVKIDTSGLLKGLDDLPVPPMSGSKWSDPIQMSAKDGTDGLSSDGEDGEDGLDGLPPAHEWNLTELRFKNPNGTDGNYVDLKGEKGDAITVTVGSPPNDPSNGDIWIA